MNQFVTTVLAGAIFVSLTGCNPTQSTPQTITASNRPVQVIELGGQQTQQFKSFSGTVQAKESSTLAFKVPGTTQSIDVKEGDRVTKGQVLGQLDPHDYQVSLDELHARMLEAKSAHKLAKAELTRVKQATQDDAIASVNLDRAISGYERSLSAVKVVEKNIQRAEDALSYTTLRAPFDGVIGSIRLEAYEQAIPGIGVVTVQKENLFEVEIQVPENMIQQFSLGQQAQLSWYQAKQSYPAVVAELSPIKHNIKQTYSVTLDIVNPPSDLFDGKAITVTTQARPNLTSYCIPYSALLGEKETLHVNVVRDKIVHQTHVELDSLDANQACITGQLYQGDYVVVAGSHYLTGGDNVTRINIKEL